MNKPNIVMITVDDMNYNSIGKYMEESITPNIDSLMARGMSFERAHVNVSVCQPSRQCIMTGKLPHNNGSYGFSPISFQVTTLPEILSGEGYYNGILSKVGHLAPIHKYCWDYIKEFQVPRYQWGRNPEDYYRCTETFLHQAKEEARPFFLMVNSNDPHRPFAGSQQEWKKYGTHVEIPKVFDSQEIKVPGFLPDLPDVRKEVAQYYGSVHRADKSLGRVMDALQEAGQLENTIVLFLSDNGMAFPFAKTNCYLNSTKTPLAIVWPNRISSGAVDRDHFISGIDLMPTLLELLELPIPNDLDGASFSSLLTEGVAMPEREHAYTLFNANFKKTSYEMRGVQTKRFGYIFNDWHDGEKEFFNESMSGLTFNAMKEAGKENADLKERVNFFLYRRDEEFYNFEEDPEGLHNLIDDPAYKEEIDRHRALIGSEMERTRDPILPSFRDKIGLR